MPIKNQEVIIINSKNFLDFNYESLAACSIFQFENIDHFEIPLKLDTFLSKENQLNTFIFKNVSSKLVEAICTSLIKRKDEISIILDESLDSKIISAIYTLCSAAPNVNVGTQHDDWQLIIKNLPSDEEKVEKFVSIYNFKMQPVLKFSFTDLCLVDVKVGSNNCYLPKIPQTLPSANLIKYYFYLIQHDKFNRDLFLKFSRNYFSGPLCDDLDYRLHQGIILSNHIFEGFNLHKEKLVKELNSILTQEGIYFSLCDFDVWLRDFIITLGNGEHHIHEEKTLTNDHKEMLETIAMADPTSNYSRDWPTNFSCSLSGSSIEEESAANRKAILNYCEHNKIPFKMDKVLSEGGNVVTVLFKNKIYSIIGKNLRISNAVYRYANTNSIPDYQKKVEELLQKYLNKSNSNNTIFYTACEDDDLSVQTGHIKEARIAVEESLNLNHDQAIWVPNPDFHIDLMLAPGPEGIIFLQNFEMVAKIAREDFMRNHNALSKNVMEISDQFHKISGDILAKIKEKLMKKGFKVIDVPGVIYFYNDKNQPDPYEMLGNFMNGYTGIGKLGRFHICLRSEIEIFNKTFEKILKANGVDHVYFIGEKNSVSSLLQDYGALRCLSMPGTLFNNFTSTKPEFKNIQIEKKQPLKRFLVNHSLNDDDNKSMKKTKFNNDVPKHNLGIFPLSQHIVTNNSQPIPNHDIKNLLAPQSLK